MNTTNSTNEQGIKEWSKESGLSEVYIRRMVNKGVIPSHKVVITEGGVEKNMITREDFETFRKTRNHSQRTDGRNRFLLYVTPEELEKIQELLTENGIESIIEKQPQYKKESEVTE